jgi:hypothetical protein
MEISLMQAHKRTKLRALLAACVNTHTALLALLIYLPGKGDAEQSTQTRLKQQEAIQLVTELRMLV